MPVPRRFDRRPPERDTTRVNERIRVPEVRLIGDDGQQIGILRTPDALKYAQDRDLDLVEVAPEARPPVCRVLDYSKYRYEQAQKVKAARKHQQQITIREIKFRPKIAQNDYDTKKGHVTRFLRHKDKVKVTIMFRGREVTHPERGEALLSRLAEELADIGVVEQRPIQDGRNMTMMLGPSRSILAEPDVRKPGDKHADGEEQAPGGEEAVAAAPAAETAAEPAAAERPAAERPAGDRPAADPAAADRPAAEPAAADRPAAEPAAPEGPAADRPAAAARPAARAAAARPAARAAAKPAAPRAKADSDAADEKPAANGDAEATDAPRASDRAAAR
jgi:translation initiation factor IF-3